MQCGVACLQMICKYLGREYTVDSLSKLCFATTEGVSLLCINEAANTLGLHTVCARATTDMLSNEPLPCILYWNQNHFVVLYKVKREKKFYVADPGKGLVTYSLNDFKQHWISTSSNGEDKGIAMFLETTPAFFTYNMECEENVKEKRSFRFLFGYVKKYRKYFGQIIFGLVIGSLLLLVLPFLTQSIVDVGIKNQDIGFVWLILLGQLTLTISRTYEFITSMQEIKLHAAIPKDKISLPTQKKLQVKLPNLQQFLFYLSLKIFLITQMLYYLMRPRFFKVVFKRRK